MRRIENMYVQFRGVRNTDVGAVMTALPVRQQTAVRGDKQTLPGRDGFLLTPTGYQEITFKQDFAVPDPANMPAVRAWLHGTGELIFGDDPDHAWDAMILSPIGMSPIMRRLDGQKLSVTWTCQPFRHRVTETDIVLTSTDLFNGEGDVSAMPIVKVEGDGSSLPLIINERSMLLNLTAGTPLYIDCDAGLAYILGAEQDLIFAGDQVVVEDDWYELKPKTGVTDTANWNYVTIPAGITQVTITPRWRWL